MLAEGIEIAVTVLYVFSTKSRIKWLLPAAWGMISLAFLLSFFLSKGVLVVRIYNLIICIAMILLSDTVGYGEKQFVSLRIQ